MGKYVTLKQNGIYLYAFDIENTPLEYCSIQELDAMLSPQLGIYCNYDIEQHSELPIECENQIKETKKWFKKSLEQIQNIDTSLFEKYLQENNVYFKYEHKESKFPPSKWYRFKMWLFGKKKIGIETSHGITVKTYSNTYKGIHFVYKTKVTEDKNEKRPKE